jgi:lipoate-protein ligase A
VDEMEDVSMIQFWVSKEHNVFHNLAIEAWLLKHTDDAHILFWYNDPSVVIGRNQIPWQEANIDDLYQLGGSLARRMSGGGAVYHDRGNLNISFINVGSKEENHKTMKDALLSLGIDAVVSERGGISITCGKVSGSAYYLFQNKLLHHLTLLVDSDLDLLWKFLKQDNESSDSKAVHSVREKVANLSELKPNITLDDVMTSIMSVHHASILQEITLEKNQTILEYVKEFNSWDWVYGKTPEFDKQHDECQVKVKKGKIVEVMGNSNYQQLIGKNYQPKTFEHQIFKEEAHVF